jgi:hypothetical protein
MFVSTLSRRMAFKSTSARGTRCMSSTTSNPFISSPLTSTVGFIALTAAIGTFMYYTDDELPHIKNETEIAGLQRKPTWYKKEQS